MIASLKSMFELGTSRLSKGTDVTRIDASARHDLGHLAFGEDGKVYRYVKFVDAIAYVAGHVCVLASATTWNVTNDKAGGAALAGLECAGIALAVQTANSFGWIQVAGIADVLVTGAAVIAGDRLVVDETVDGAAREIVYTTYAAIQERNVGTALAVIGTGLTGKVKLAGLL